MIVIVTRNVTLRPIRSPMRPKKNAPKGRTKKPDIDEREDAENSESVVALGKELLAENGEETGEDIEVVPLDRGPRRRRANDSAELVVIDVRPLHGSCQLSLLTQRRVLENTSERRRARDARQPRAGRSHRIKPDCEWLPPPVEEPRDFVRYPNSYYSLPKHPKTHEAGGRRWARRAYRAWQAMTSLPSAQARAKMPSVNRQPPPHARSKPSSSIATVSYSIPRPTGPRPKPRFSQRYGKTFGRDHKLRMIGSSLQATGEILEELLEQPGRASEINDEMLELVEEAMVASEPMPGAADLVAELRGRVPIALASNSWRRLITVALHAADLTDSFDVVVCGDEVSHPKPAPDIYLETARLLTVAPERTIALEDSANGVRAAPRGWDVRDRHSLVRRDCVTGGPHHCRLAQVRRRQASFGPAVNRFVFFFSFGRGSLR